MLKFQLLEKINAKMRYTKIWNAISPLYDHDADAQLCLYPILYAPVGDGRCCCWCVMCACAAETLNTIKSESFAAARECACGECKQ